MRRRLGVIVVLAALAGACGGKQSAAPAPQTMQEAVTKFLAAVKDSNIAQMGRLWGDQRGPAIGWMEPVTLSQYATHIVDHDIEHLAQLQACRAIVLAY